MSLTDALKLDVQREIDDLSVAIRTQVRTLVRRRGAVIAVSGGIDSATCAALCTYALGKEHVMTLALPERDSSPDSTKLGQELATRLDVRHSVHDITAILEAAGCYQTQIDAIRMIVPEYGTGWKHKVVLPSILNEDRLNVSRLTVQSPDGALRTERIPIHAYLQLVAATNFKQRTRTMVTYFEADRLNYAVCGTPNRLEYDQGFFVKQGDGAADFKPIAHLYKSQVYQLAEALGVPEGILRRTPTTDTYSLPQTQEEFYFSVPYRVMDLCLYAVNHRVSAAETAHATGLSLEQVGRVFRDIEHKRRATLPLHLPPILSEELPEITHLIDGAVARGRKT